ncbi:MAG: palindromic element RPE1 domain-containing protein [Candidatus Tisiphia sp.]
MLINNRLLAEFAAAPKFIGDTARKTASSTASVREDLSTGSTYKLPTEVELCKKSNGDVAKISTKIRELLTIIHISHASELLGIVFIDKKILEINNSYNLRMLD